MKTYYLITFASTHLAIRTERILKAHMDVTMIPTPRELSASCGLSIMMETEEPETFCSALSGEGFEGMSLYKVTRDTSGKREYTALQWRC